LVKSIINIPPFPKLKDPKKSIKLPELPPIDLCGSAPGIEGHKK